MQQQSCESADPEPMISCRIKELFSAESVHSKVSSEDIVPSLKDLNLDKHVVKTVIKKLCRFNNVTKSWSLL